MSTQLTLPFRLANLETLVKQKIQFINSCQEGKSFLRHTAFFLEWVYNNPIIGPYFRELIKIHRKKKKEIQEELLFLYENEWIFLAKYCRSFYLRKQLLRIRRLAINCNGLITGNIGSLIADEIDSLRNVLPITKEIKKVQFQFKMMERQLPCPCVKCRMKKIAGENSRLICISLSNDQTYLSLGFYKPKDPYENLVWKNIIPCTSYMSSYYWHEFWKRNKDITISGKLVDKLIELNMEIDEIYFYSEMFLLKDIYTFQIMPPSNNNFISYSNKARWKEIKKSICNISLEQIDRSRLIYSLPRLEKNFSKIGKIKINPLLSYQCNITRENMEHYLLLLEQRISVILLEGKFKRYKSKEKICLKKSEEKRILCRELAKEFWYENPTGTIEECYKYYKVRTGNDRYELSTFKKYIAKDGLDPRPPEQKVRGKGRKSKKKWN